MKIFSTFCRTMLLVAVSLTAEQSLTAQELKIGVIDFARIQREYFRTDLERKKFEANRSERLQAVEGMKARIRDLTELQRAAQEKLQDPSESEDAKKLIMTEAQERAGMITSLQREALIKENESNEALANEANAVQKALTGEINEAISSVAKEAGFAFVLNRTFGINGIPPVPYVDEEQTQDFTDEVIAALNANAPPAVE